MGAGLGVAFCIRQKIKAGQRVRPVTHVHENKVQRERLKNTGCRISHQSPVLVTSGTRECIPTKHRIVEKASVYAVGTYFFRRGLRAAFLADLDDAGGGAFSILRNASSNPIPFAVMAFVFTLLASSLPFLFRHQKPKVKS